VGYFLRVLSTSAGCEPLAALESALAKENVRARLSLGAGEPDQWTELRLTHWDGREIAQIERYLVAPDSLASEELAEFEDEVSGCQPKSAAQWLSAYFQRVQCVYSFQALARTEDADGWRILRSVKDHIWSAAPAILQADGEGFTNEDGYHILWQFSHSVSGSWWMGVLQAGQWKHFEMDLGNAQHRRAFLDGHVPDGATMA
jgi:hypothetical protein